RSARPPSTAWRPAWRRSAPLPARSTTRRCRGSTLWSSSCSARREPSTGCSARSTTTRSRSCSGPSAASRDRASRDSRTERARVALGRSVYIALLGIALACAGCGISPISSAPEVTQYDFGPDPTKDSAPALRQALLVYDVNAPAWLDSQNIYYRLAYQDAARPQAYADSPWVGSPAGLIPG